MSVLKNLRRVLVRATLTSTTTSTAIADVAMDTVTEMSPGFTPAKEIEVRKYGSTSNAYIVNVRIAALTIISLKA